MKQIYIIGGGAAGFFAAIRHKELYPKHEVTMLERNINLLAKVKISGGGRCNVTHNCLNVTDLVKFYPRGRKELISPFKRFGPAETIAWFAERGVALKVENDNRMFPITDDSQTIVDALLEEAKKLGVHILVGRGLNDIMKEGNKWILLCNEEEAYEADAVMMAFGSSPATWQLLAKLGHTIVPPVPSLFTFQIQDERLRDISGISLHEVIVSVSGTKLKEKGPLLITHTGLSGPAILRLSAWGARELHEFDYKFEISVSFAPEYQYEAAYQHIAQIKDDFPKRQISAHPQFDLPQRLWKKLLTFAQIPENETYAQVTKKQMQALALTIVEAKMQVKGKSTFKEEFVTSGGISLKDVDFKTMQSKLLPNVFFGGECLDIDAITGGFNFQAAWTTGWIAGEGMGL